ncbi:MAG: carboxypeptidase-like regulatory domain-containing protein [Gemmatimonadota bacterium]
MTRMPTLFIAAPAILFIGLSRPAVGQELSGRLEQIQTRQPLSGALVVLVDSAGHEVTRTVSSPSGAFAVRAPFSGRFQVRVLRIGARPWSSVPLMLAPGERREIRLTLEDNPVLLPEIEIRAAGNRCGLRPGDSDAMARLLTEAEKALAIATETIREGQLQFRTETWTNRPHPDGTPGERERRTSLGVAAWPVQSAPPESLAIWGFVHDGPPYGTPEELVTERGPVFYGPDERVLFANWFLDAHCFSVEADSSSAGPVLVMRFRPARPRRGVDIAGTLRLNRETLELRGITFRYTGLGSWVPPDSAGGELSFRRLRSGAMIIDRWTLRAPIPLFRAGSPTRFFGFAESGGRVIEVQRGRTGEPERLSLTSSLWRSDL